ncbi:glioma pathogenesis-related protein 1 [Alosa pseudoharengus]|uniref:glioma pathogenesis-related protein 1 n=1 Tax=Alosa pseudoharengus TaxID=34774 RepID=UPI003F8A5007
MAGRWMGVVCLMIVMEFPAMVMPTPGLPLPDITDEKFIDDCVKSHNLNRSRVKPAAGNMRYMTWDAALAITARAWARMCVFDHNIYLKDVKKVHPTFPSVGENLWTGYPPNSFSVEEAMKSWVDGELKDYNYDHNYCTPGKPCGHYTQVVWADSYKVGCAVHLCPDGVKGFSEGHASAHFLCNYSPAGNFQGEKPYLTGGKCSKCAATDTCDGSLCHDPTRDAIRRYHWSPEWDPEKTTCGTFCLAVLVLRPVALLLIFASAYTIKMQYPDIFVYE